MFLHWHCFKQIKKKPIEFCEAKIQHSNHRSRLSIHRLMVHKTLIWLASVRRWSPRSSASQIILIITHQSPVPICATRMCTQCSREKRDEFQVKHNQRLKIVLCAEPVFGLADRYCFEPRRFFFFFRVKIDVAQPKDDDFLLCSPHYSSLSCCEIWSIRCFNFFDAFLTSDLIFWKFFIYRKKRLIFESTNRARARIYL